MEKNKIGESFRKSFTGVIKPSAHADNMKMRGGHMFLMIVIISLLTALATVAGMISWHDFLDAHWSNLPAFVFENGELSVDSRIILPLTDMDTPTLFIVDTNVDDSLDTTAQQDMIGEALKLMAEQAKCSQVLFLGRHNFMVWVNWQMRGIPYTVLFHNQAALNNETAKPLMHNLLNIWMVFFAIFMFVLMIAVYYICVLFYALVGAILNLILRTEAAFGDIYKISLSAAFPIWIIKQLVTVTGVKNVTMYSGRIFRIAILLYIGFALLAKSRLEREQEEQAADRFGNGIDGQMGSMGNYYGSGIDGQMGSMGDYYGNGMDGQTNGYGSEDNYHV